MDTRIFIAMLLYVLSTFIVIGEEQRFQHVVISEAEFNEAMSTSHEYTLDLIPHYFGKRVQNEIIYEIINRDEKALGVFIETLECPEEFQVNFYLINLPKPLMLIEFVSPIWNFSYIAFENRVNEWKLIDKKFNSAKMSISKDGYLEGDEEVVDAFYVHMSIYRLYFNEVDSAPTFDEVYGYANKDGQFWAIDSCFWNEKGLYVEGRELKDDKTIPYYCIFEFVKE